MFYTVTQQSLGGLGRNTKTVSQTKLAQAAARCIFSFVPKQVSC